MLIPLSTEYPLRRNPYANYVLIGLNVVVFILQRLNPGLVAALDLPAQDPKWWNFISYQFLHGGFLHILGNMVFLYVFGNNVNDKMGNTLYVLFYLAGGIAAGAAHVLTSIHPVIGASGSVAAVTGAFLVFFPKVHVSILWVFILITRVDVPAMYLVILFFLKDLFFQFAPGDSGTAHMAHIGGTVFGFAICFALLLLKLVQPNPFDLFAVLKRWNRKRQYRDTVASGYDPFSYGGSKIDRAAAARETVKPNPAQDRIHDLRAEISAAISSHDLDTALNRYTALRQLDPQQVLPTQQQEDIANELFSRGQYSNAAEAYEAFLRAYARTAERQQVGRVWLMTGLIFSRYVINSDRAVAAFDTAIPLLSSERDIALARAERQRIGGNSPPPLPTA